MSPLKTGHQCIHVYLSNAGSLINEPTFCDTTQIITEFEVHTTQLRQWKKQALEAIQAGFSTKRDRDKADQEELLTNLYEQIGQLQFAVF